MRLKNGTTVNLQKLHEKLHLSQSSLPSSLTGLPERLNFIGMVISYAEVQMVAWQKEVIFVISQGSIESLKISMWLNHENPIGLRFAENEPILGRMVYFKNVRITSFDFTCAKELQFYGEMNPPSPSMHTILVPVISGGLYMQYIKRKRPFKINDMVSLIPKQLFGKRSTSFYPLLPDDYEATNEILGLLVTFAECMVKNIHFNPAINPFQNFVNSQLALVNSTTQMDSQRVKRRCQYWLASYYQHAEWFSKQPTV